MTVDERIEFLLQSTERHNQQLGELTAKMSDLTAKMTQLVEVTNQDATAIRALVRIVEIHEQRLTDLESDE